VPRRRMVTASPQYLHRQHPSVHNYCRSPRALRKQSSSYRHPNAARAEARAEAVTTKAAKAAAKFVGILQLQSARNYLCIGPHRNLLGVCIRRRMHRCIWNGVKKTKSIEDRLPDGATPCGGGRRHRRQHFSRPMG